jgi:hypothetical protein
LPEHAGGVRLGTSFLNDGDRDYRGDSGIDQDNRNDTDEDRSEDYQQPENDTVYRDQDDQNALLVGQDVSAVDKVAITSVVNHYYKAVASWNGAAGCSLLLKGLANGLSREYGGPGGPSYLRGATSCGEVLTRVFARFDPQRASIRVTGVRRLGADAAVFLGSTEMPASQIFVAHEADGWRLSTLFGRVLD